MTTQFVYKFVYRNEKKSLFQDFLRQSGGDDGRSSIFPGSLRNQVIIAKNPDFIDFL